MQKLIQCFSLIMLLGFFGLANAQFVMDGDSTDWVKEPILVTALDNLQDYFPDEVGAAFSDRVNVKQIRAKIYGNAIYFFIRFWGGPVWPNLAYVKEDPTYGHIIRNRGYYHLMMDLDNNPTTGWNSHWYEVHYTPLGYYASQGLPDTDAIGAECYLEMGVSGGWSAPHPDGGKVTEVVYYAEDTHEIDYQAGTGNGFDMYQFEVDNPDSNKAKKHSGSLWEKGMGTDSLRQFWAGHAWGHDFLEYGVELTWFQEYWEKMGMSYLNPGDKVGICAFIETPVDDWGVDVSPRGELVVPEIKKRPSTITFDGDSSDWNDKPILCQAQDNLQDYFPDEVGGAFSDRVDVKHIKAFVNLDEDVLYFFLRFWGGPVWPNYAYIKEDVTYGHIVRHRGYYHLMMDLDNDVSTGWNSHWYEVHYTPVGYYYSQGDTKATAIGAECYLEMGFSAGWTAPHPDNGKVNDIDYYAEDVHEIDYQAGTGNGFDMYGFIPMNVDSNDMKQHDCFMYDEEVQNDSILHWGGHAWGHDFLESGVSLGSFREYWAKQGKEYLKLGDVIGVCAFVETPVDDWGVDVSPRGEFIVGKETAVDNDNSLITKQFELSENYPNPFNPQTTIRYTMPATAEVKIEIFNTLGQKVRTLVNQVTVQGQHTAIWDGRNDFGENVSSGTYFYKMKSGSFNQTKRMVLLK